MNKNIEESSFHNSGFLIQLNEMLFYFEKRIVVRYDKTIINIDKDGDYEKIFDFDVWLPNE